MNSFLSNVARQLLDTYGHDLSRVTVVFPNKRASLFLNQELAQQARQPVWSPAYTTISQLFRSQSERQVADPIKLVCDLYKSFLRATGIDETLDHFYGWGEILLADFDDVDKHIVRADKVFANLRDLHEYDDDSYLTEQQRAAIRQFFSNFSEDHNSELKQRFLSLWSHIGDIYTDFNRRLAAQGLAYEGALYREVAGREELALESDHYVFVGFNLLLPVEQRLIQRLGQKATVISDGDEEAAKQITFVSAATENIQARYVSTWLQEQNRIALGFRTAVVLADEKLLKSVIHCLPDTVSKVNVTTGYPLAQTAIVADINFAEALQSGALQPLMETVRAKASEAANPLEAEACFRLYTLLNRLQALIDAGDLCVQPLTLQRLLMQIINSTTIPFHGEPLEGIQVMGVLETRNLDFDQVLLLSCNEGNLPKGVNDTSFIPYSIRKAYGLTTIDYKVAIYENYFRRLIQRAKDVTLVYNNSTSDGKTGEMSQFMLQLMVSARHPIAYRTLQAGQQTVMRIPRPIAKSTAVMQALRRRYCPEGLVSPSALARYLRCPLQFFYRYVTDIDQPEEEEDNIDNRLFGNIFHKAAQLLYERLKAHSSTVTATDIDRLLKEEADIHRAVDEALKTEFFHIEDPQAPLPPLDGLQLINREVIIRYMHQLLEIDRRLTPFTILGLEKFVSITAGELLTEVPALLAPDTKIGGIIDRLDMITLPDGSSRIRVVDYKTGARQHTALPSVEAIFQPDSIKNHSDYYLQAFLYAMIVDRQQTKGTPVSPCLLFIQHAASENFDPTLLLGKAPVNSIREVAETYNTLLQQLVTEIFSPDVPFNPTDDRNRCINCPYRLLCGL